MSNIKTIIDQIAALPHKDRIELIHKLQGAAANDADLLSYGKKPDNTHYIGLVQEYADKDKKKAGPEVDQPAAPSKSSVTVSQKVNK